MQRAEIIRSVVLLFPLLTTCALWLIFRPGPKLRASLFLGTGWNLALLLPANFFAVQMGWWQFHASSALLLGIPADLWLGWAIWWGAVGNLAHRVPIFLRVIIFLWIDLLAMPACAPLLELGPHWILGEILLVLTSLIPSLFLGRWTMGNRHVALRGRMQAIAFGLLVAVLPPALVAAHTPGAFDHLATRPRWLHLLLLQLCLAPVAVGISAVREFATEGKGTPVPFDPPSRMVTTGIYAYVANPMQLAMALFLLAWGSFLGSAWVAAGSFIAVAYGLGLAGSSEHADLSLRYGNAWQKYRRAVPEWIPRLRPWTVPGAPLPVLYIKRECRACAGLRHWIEKRKPSGLVLTHAEDFPGPGRLERLTYLSSAGSTLCGLEAWARAVMHIHIGWAIVGAVVCLPGVRQLAQVICDASGGGPDRTAQTGQETGQANESATKI